METDNPLEKLLDRLREKGWCKEDLGTEQGPNCILGADMWLGQCTDFDTQLVPIIKAEYPNRLNSWNEVGFNNHPDTTFSDIERVLEKAAVKWEEERVTR